jgi:hypothetical protein
MWNEDDDEALAQHTCSTCGTTSPKTAGTFTLISSRFGWRLWREPTPTGIELRWFCPTCWKARKDDGRGGPPSSRG